MQQGGETPTGIQVRLQVDADLLDHEGMLGDGEGVVARGLAIPSGDPRQSMGDILDLDVEGRGVKQVQPSPGQHALPGPGGTCDRTLHA